MLEDVVTTGETLKAEVNKLLESDVNVIAAIAFVDRNSELKLNVPYYPMSYLSEIIDYFNSL